ncbi:MAG: DUF3034 family protein [Thermomonas sp.]
MTSSDHRQSRRRLGIALAALFALPATGIAADGRLLATGGATQFEGSAGGGIVPWAVLSGYGTDTQNGGTAFATRVDTGDYSLDATGVAYTFRNRVELSYARQRFGLGELQRRLTLPVGRFDAEVIGAKVRLGGDLVYTAMPQVSLGVQHKRQLDFAIPSAVGARDDSGTDVYVAASKLFLGAAFDRHLLLNATLRSTSANQAGLLGFGGDRKAGRSLVLESSVAVLLDPRWAVGVEYRQKPDNLGFAREDDWKDAFVAWFPNKHVAVVAAYADLGSIATLDKQRGPYLSLQASF